MAKATPSRALISFLFSGRLEILIRSLDAAFAQEYAPFSVLVADCLPSGQFESIIKSRFPGLIYIKTSADTGIASGRNFAMGHYLSMDCDYIFLLDDDILLERDCLARLVSAMQDDPSLGLAAPLILNEDGSALSAGGTYNHVFGQPFLLKKADVADCPLDFASGAIGLFRKETLVRVGPFDTAFDPYGFEDVDYGLRVKSKGYRVGLAPEAACRHLTDYSFHREREFYLYHTTRGRLLCAYKHAGLFLFVFAAFPWILLRRVVFPVMKFFAQGKAHLSRAVARGFMDAAGDILKGGNAFSRAFKG
ncbi:MAG: glycosyltransferase family 2 protein [Nitrospinae bacterium]|nr:glycosyltransferase family 2 protein [Nitrospinota bacterium]